MRASLVVLLVLLLGAQSRAEPLRLVTSSTEIARLDRRQEHFTVGGVVLVTWGVLVQLTGVVLLVATSACGLGGHPSSCRDFGWQAAVEGTGIAVGSLSFIAGTVLLGTAAADRRQIRRLKVLAPSLSLAPNAVTMQWGVRF